MRVRPARVLHVVGDSPLAGEFRRLITAGAVPGWDLHPVPVGRTPLPRDELSGAWSGDTSAVSWLVPTIQPQVAMTDAPPHSHEFHDASATPEAAAAVHDAAVVMALTAVDLMSSPGLMERVTAEHAQSVSRS